MNDLEIKIADWREQMLAAGVKSPVPMEELENHLREDIEERMTGGLNLEEAFEAASTQMGAGRDLNLEFKRAETLTQENRMKKNVKIVMIATGVFGGLLGTAIILPALAQHFKQGAPWAAGVIIPLCVGVAILVGGAVVAYSGVVKYRAARGK